MIKKIVLLVFGFGVILFFYYSNTKNTPKQFQKHISLKPPIITEDNVTLAYSKPLYKVMIDREAIFACVDRNECSLLHILQSLLGFDMNKAKYYANKYKYFPLSYDVNETLAKDLQWLSQRLKPFYDKKAQKYYRPLLIQLSGEKRVYPYKDTLTPVLGHTRKKEKSSLTITQGVMGLEAIKTDTKLITTINFSLQKKLENTIDSLQTKSKEVIAAILDLNTNEIKAIASTFRYDPNLIKRSDIPKFATHCNQYLFSSLALLKPLIIAIEAQEKKNIQSITPQKLLDYIDKFKLRQKNSELPNERQMNIVKHLQEGSKIEDIKLNFLQTLKLYATFYRNGRLAQPKIIKNTKTIEAPIISPTLAQKITKRNDTNQTVLLQFPDGNKTANLQIKRDKNLFTIMLYLY